MKRSIRTVTIEQRHRAELEHGIMECADGFVAFGS
jgi:hypothetical protein